MGALWIDDLEKGGGVMVSSFLGPFVGRSNQALVGTATDTKTLPCWPASLERRWRQHLDGVARLGLFPTLSTGRCMFGVVDLDCHDNVTPERHGEAARLVAFLWRIGIVAYRVPSRGARGAHVWLFFRAPGVPWRDLHAFLDTFALELRRTGHVDVIPCSTGEGGVFLPYYMGTVNVFDEHGAPVPLDGLAQNDPAVIPATSRPESKPTEPSWPPPEWNLRGGFAKAIPAALEDVKDQLFRGHDNLLRAKMGARNRLAGMTASLIVRRGGTFDDFKAWDASNQPPLATDEPVNLANWWSYAERKRQRPKSIDVGTAAASPSAGCRGAAARQPRQCHGGSTEKAEDSHQGNGGRR